MAIPLELLINAANLLYLCAYMVRDILWLRILTVVAAACLLPYFYLQAQPLMTPIYWNLVFMALNLFWIVLLLLERRPVKLSEEERRLCELVFRTMTPREMTKILKLASWHDAAAGECFVPRGQALDRLMVIYAGRACVEVAGKPVAELDPGRFIGSISYLTEETAPADIVALEPTRYVCWPKSRLKAFMQGNPELYGAMQTTLAIDLTRWLEASWARHPGPAQGA
jgi:hypothetical protein